MNEKIMRRCFDAIDAIACSHRVKDFYVGYTYRTGAHRLQEQNYFRRWDHVVAIAERMTFHDAEKLERELQRRCKEEPKFVTNTKYSKEHLVRAYNPGKKSPIPHASIHSVYMMWCTND